MKFINSAVIAVLSLHTSSAFTNTGKSPSITFTQSKSATFAPFNYGLLLKNQDVSLHVEATRITMPALSSTMKEGRVISWMKSEGDAVSAGEVLYVVESDKADMDVEGKIEHLPFIIFLCSKQSQLLLISMLYFSSL